MSCVREREGKGYRDGSGCEGVRACVGEIQERRKGKESKGGWSDESFGFDRIG